MAVINKTSQKSVVKAATMKTTGILINLIILVILSVLGIVISKKQKLNFSFIEEDYSSFLKNFLFKLIFIFS